MVNIQKKFYENDESLNLFLKLLEAPLGPFDAEKAFRAAICLDLELNSLYTKKATLKACGLIVKSHPDLSQFFKNKTAITNEDPKAARVTSFISQFISEVIPWLVESDKLDVTLEDWKKCGYIPPE